MTTFLKLKLAHIIWQDFPLKTWTGLVSWMVMWCRQKAGPCVFHTGHTMHISKPAALFRPELERCERWNITRRRKSGLVSAMQSLSDWVLGWIQCSALHTSAPDFKLFQNQTDYDVSWESCWRRLFAFFLTTCSWRAPIMGSQFSSASIPSKEYSMRYKLVSQNHSSSHQECWLI